MRLEVSSATKRRMRKTVQSVVKSGFAKLGLHVRYAFQFPSAMEPQVLGRFFANDPGQVRTVFDVGANVGQTALYVEQHYPNAHVYAFEPFSAVYALLNQATLGHTRITAQHCALGSASAELRVLFNGDPRSQSNRITPSAGSAPGAEENIQVETVDGFCSARSIESIDILKTDTEGHDADVLTGASRMLEEGRVRVVVSEAGFMGDASHTAFERLHALLAPRGFELAGVYEMSYLRDGRCDFCNAVFVKS